MIAAGIDLGGTKIEAQIFAPDWSAAARKRVDTPKTYAALVTALAEMTAWIDSQHSGLPIGISAAGLINRSTGLALTANLPATGHPFAADLQATTGKAIPIINDCRALTLSEAVFGAAKGCDPAVGLILGTGIGGGVAVRGRLVEGPSGTGGEFGHFPLSATQVQRHGLPIVACGCGRQGCTETLISGPGLTRLAQHVTGQNLTPQEIATRYQTEPNIAKIWQIWCDLVVDLLITLTMTIDPAVVVLGGGLSRIAGLIDALTPALKAAQLNSFAVPDLRLAQGGDASGARGAAWNAFTLVQHD